MKKMKMNIKIKIISFLLLLVLITTLINTKAYSIINKPVNKKFTSASQL